MWLFRPLLGQLKFLLQRLERRFIISFAPVCAGDMRQTQGNFSWVVAFLEKTKRLLHQRQTFVNTKLLNVQTPEIHEARCLAPSPFVGPRKLQRLLEVFLGLAVITAILK